MNKAAKLLKSCEEAPAELQTSVDGDPSHNHPEVFDEFGHLTGLGKANNGPAHSHKLETDDDDKVTILAAGADKHTHRPSGDKPPVQNTLTDLEQAQAGIIDDDGLVSTDDGEDGYE